MASQAENDKRYDYAISTPPITAHNTPNPAVVTGNPPNVEDAPVHDSGFGHSNHPNVAVDGRTA